MKVYVVFEHFPYEEETIVAICESREKAEVRVKSEIEHGIKHYQYYWREYEVE